MVFFLYYGRCSEERTISVEKKCHSFMTISCLVIKNLAQF